MMEKIDLDGTTKYFKTTKTDIVNKMTKSRIMFRGIKTSSGNQTAKLKSIQGITTLSAMKRKSGQAKMSSTR